MDVRRLRSRRPGLVAQVRRLLQQLTAVLRRLRLRRGVELFHFGDGATGQRVLQARRGVDAVGVAADVVGVVRHFRALVRRLRAVVVVGRGGAIAAVERVEGVAVAAVAKVHVLPAQADVVLSARNVAAQAGAVVLQLQRLQRGTEALLLHGEVAAVVVLRRAATQPRRFVGKAGVFHRLTQTAVVVLARGVVQELRVGVLQTVAAQQRVVLQLHLRTVKQDAVTLLLLPLVDAVVVHALPPLVALHIGVHQCVCHVCSLLPCLDERCGHQQHHAEGDQHQRNSDTRPHKRAGVGFHFQSLLRVNLHTGFAILHLLSFQCVSALFTPCTVRGECKKPREVATSRGFVLGGRKLRPPL